MKISKLIVIIITYIYISTISIYAQFDSQPPSSYYGFGQLQKNQLQNGSGLGGIYHTLRDSAFINYLNPASYTSIDVTQLIFGVEVNSVNSNGLSNQAININQFGIGFPIVHKHKFFQWGMYGGFAPFSLNGYKLNDTIERIILPDTFDVYYQYRGTGGFNKITIGNGFQFGRHLSIGANVNFLFGNSTQVFDELMPFSLNFLSTRVQEKTTLNNFTFDFGVQSFFDFKVRKITKKNDKRDTTFTKYNLTFGATYSLGNSFNGRFQKTATQYYNNPQQTPLDTFSLGNATEGGITLPHHIGGGFAISNKGIWTLSTEFNFSTWGGFKYFTQPNLPFFDSYSINTGFDFRPNYRDRNKNPRFLKNIIYRAGFKYFNRFYRPDSNPVDDFGISFGLGLPVHFALAKNAEETVITVPSYINLSFEGGVANSRITNFVNETYFRFTIGFTLRDQWFTKRYYN